MPASFLEEGLPYLMLFAGVALTVAAGYHSRWIVPRAKSVFKFQPGVDKAAELVIFGFMLSVFFPALANSAFAAFFAIIIGGGMLFALFFRKSVLEGITAMLVLAVAFNFG